MSSTPAPRLRLVGDREVDQGVEHPQDRPAEPEADGFRVWVAEERKREEANHEQRQDGGSRA